MNRRQFLSASALGADCDDLSGFVVMESGQAQPLVGRYWASGVHQGVKRNSRSPLVHFSGNPAGGNQEQLLAVASDVLNRHVTDLKRRSLSRCLGKSQISRALAAIFLTCLIMRSFLDGLPHNLCGHSSLSKLPPEQLCHS